jgi:hypothetical protein
VPPTAQHEALHRIFQHDEALFARAVARVFNVLVPAPVNVTVLSTDLTETEPIERRADSVLQAEFMVEEAAGKYILVIESQTEPDEERRRRWPHYITHLHDKYGCPVVLAVVCNKRYTARWARAPIKIGLPGLTCVTARLVVFGPDNVPAITDPQEAADDVTLTVFSALTHSRRPDLGGILEALAAALNTIDPESAAYLAEFTETGLGDTVGRQTWRALMATRTYPFVSQMRLQGREEGRIETLAEAIFTVFEGRGIAVDDVSRERIESCSDADLLRAWLARSGVVATVSELFT